MAVPTYDDLFNPLLKAMHDLGGSGSVTEIKDRVAKLLKLSDADINVIHKGNTSRLSYRLAWARNYLKRYKLLENSSRGVWALTDEGKKTFSVNKQEVSRAVKALDIVVQSDKSSTESEGTEISEAVWKEKLLNAIMSMKPNSFERFCQRLLRESGFIQVEVTGKSGDGGIDGKGIMRLGLLSFHVIFQCKRYKGSVPSKEIRDFRGAMVGRADKGLFITTGTFTRDSKSEACRDGAPPIDLIDGDQLIEKIKELGLGVKIKTEEVIEVNTEWFKFF